MVKVIWSIGQLGWQVYLNSRRTERFMGELRGIVAHHGYAISAQTEDRIRLYTMLIAITSHWFCLLRGTPPNREEIDYALRLGAFTPVADDLMDDSGLSFEDLHAQTDHSSSEHVLFAYLLERLNSLRQMSPAFNRYFVEAHKAQNVSLLQLQKEPLDLAYLEHITYEKGGYYALLYRTVLQHPLMEGEQEFVYTVGAITQILNDIFDLHKDFHNGVQSIVTRTADMHVASRTLNDLVERLRKEIFALDYPQKNKDRAFRSILAIVARGYVALEHFFKVQGSRPKIDVAAHSQVELLVDMEKPVNVWKNVYYTWRATR